MPKKIYKIVVLLNKLSTEDANLLSAEIEGLCEEYGATYLSN